MTAIITPVFGPSTLPTPPVPPLVPELPPLLVVPPPFELVPPVFVTCPIRAHFWMVVDSPTDNWQFDKPLLINTALDIRFNRWLSSVREPFAKTP